MLRRDISFQYERTYNFNNGSCRTAVYCAALIHEMKIEYKVAEILKNKNL
jgi:hypothetical protein